MKYVYFYIFLLTFELFTPPSQGLPIGYARGCNRRHLKSRAGNLRKHLKTPWKADKRENVRTITMVNCDCPSTVRSQPRKTVNCHPVEDDPEKWFVKVYQIPDTRPQRFILCSLNDDTPEPEPVQPRNKSIDVNQEFKRCTLHCDNDRLILRCTPHTKRASKNCVSVFCTKFLQINEPEELKNSVLSAIVRGNNP